MATFTIRGGVPLYGSVRLGGAKNASFKLMIASLLSKDKQETRLLNFSHIEDVEITRDIIESLGGKTRNAGERTVFIDAHSLNSFTVSDDFGPKSRASTMFLPVLLHRFSEASVPLPGGDQIGSRPLERHFQGLEAMGVKFEIKGHRVHAQCKQLQGITYKFSKNTHTGTETLIMAAVLAKGTTVIENAALEPEVDDLITFLNEMGAHIRRRPGNTIIIHGVRSLHPTIYKIMPDRNEAVSYACAAIATKGDIIVENAQAHNLTAFLNKLDEIRAGYEVGNYGVRFYYKEPLQATDVETKPEPGFMTDWQPLWTVLMTQAEGESIIHETVHSSRFQHVEGLKKFGAQIEYIKLSVTDPDSVYNFNLSETSLDTPHAIKVTGKSELHGCTTDIYDLRSGATMVLAALTTPDQTVLNRVELIDRGYETFDERLRSMGARIMRS